MDQRDPDDLDALRAASDVLGIDALLSDDERAVRDRVRAFVDARIRPGIADWFDRGGLPGGARAGARRAGCARHDPRRLRMPRPQRRRVRPRGARARGRATPASARSCRCRARSRWARSTAGAPRSRSRSGCPGWRAARSIGCFGLTEPSAGSDPASMKTFARRDGDDWILTGSKRWIGLASIAQLAVVWAQTDDGVRGFLVPTDSPGFSATRARAEGVDAGVDPVRAALRRRPAAGIRAASRRSRSARSVRGAQRSAVRHRLGLARRGTRQLRGGAAPRPAARAVRPADRGIPADAAEARRHGARAAEGRAARAAHSDG